MSENIGKHLFEISSHGTPWYRGVITKETAKTYLLEGGHRALKHPAYVLLDAGSDPDKARRAFSVVWRSFGGEVGALEDALKDAQHRRRTAAIAALSASVSS